MQPSTIKILGHHGILPGPAVPLVAGDMPWAEHGASDRYARTLSDEQLARPDGMERWPRLDRYGKALVAVIDATLHRNSVERSSATGMVVCSQHSCTETNADFDQGFLEKGPRLASPKLFPYTLPGSTASEAAMHFELRGPYVVLPGGAAAALGAALMAIDLIECHHAEHLIVCSSDVLGPATLSTLQALDGLPKADEPPISEGSAGLWLAAAGTSEPGQRLCIEGALGAAGSIDTTTAAWSTVIQEAADRAKLPLSCIKESYSATVNNENRSVELAAIDAVAGQTHPLQMAFRTGDAGATTGLLALCAAIESDGPALVTASDDSCRVALVIHAE